MLLSILIAAALLADPPATGDAKPGAPAAPAPVKADKPKVVCHTEAVTGSLMPKRTCYTEEQSAQRRQEERQNLERIQQAPH